MILPPKLIRESTRLLTESLQGSNPCGGTGSTGMVSDERSEQSAGGVAFMKHLCYTSSMRIVQYIILNQGLGMSTGKAAAQASHAAVKGYELTRRTGTGQGLIDKWNDTGHTKIVLAARDTEHLLMIERYLKERGVACHLVIDEGRTEIDPHTPTAIGCELLDKDDPNVQFAFGDLKTYRDPPRPSPSREELIEHFSAEFGSKTWWKAFKPFTQ